MGLSKLRITGYTDKKFSSAYKKPYVAMINPESIKIQRSIDYNEQQAPDTSSPSQKYKGTPPQTLSFDIVIDCTGIVDSKRTDMSAEIKLLESVIYVYNGDIHRPNFAAVQWGQNMIFKGVLTSFDISYTLFNPDGDPLRAKISLAFSQYIDPETVALDDKENSPDVSHLVTVTEGMTLPQLCEKVWNNDSYYPQVAKFNDLNKFRNLAGIKTLIFPPIIQPV